MICSSYHTPKVLMTCLKRKAGKDAIPSTFLQPSGKPIQEWDLRDGITLKNMGHYAFKAYDSEGNLVLSLFLAKLPDSPVLAVRDIDAFVRGKGLGRRVLKILLEKFGALRS